MDKGNLRTLCWAAALCWLAPTLTASPDTVRFAHFTSDDGLSQMNVLDIYQDRQGFVWLATQDGLNRFDGVDFKYYPSTAGPMWQSFDGALWIGDRGSGLYRLDLEVDEQIRLGAEHGLSDNRILAIAGDGDAAWVANRSGLDRLDARSRRLERVFPADGEAESIRDVVLHGDDVLFIGVDRLYRRAPTGEITTVLRADPSLGHLNELTVARDGVVWLGGSGGLDRIDLDGGTRRAFRAGAPAPDAIGSGEVEVIYEDGSGRVWAGLLESGLFRLDPGSSGFRPVGGLAGKAVNSVLEDQSGLLWVGLAPGGVHVGDVDAGTFELYRNDPGDPGSLSSDIVLSFEEAGDGDLWVGTWLTGLSRLDKDTGRFTHFRHDPDDPDSLAANRVLALEQAPGGDMWVGLRSAGLDRYGAETGRFEHFRHDPDDPDSLSSDQVMDLAYDHEGRLWIATFGGLDRYEPETGRFVHLRHRPVRPRDAGPGAPEGLSSNQIQRLFVHGQDLWVSTWDGGVNRIDLGTGRIEHIRHDPSDPTSPADDAVRSTFVDSSGRLWIATNGSGLSMRSAGDDGFVHFTAAQSGLANDVVHGVLEDDRGRLWFPTNGGLSRWDPQLDAWRTFDVDDGLQHDEFNFGAFLEDSDGHFLVGGLRGFNRFDPADFPRVTRKPRVVLTRFEGLGHDLGLGVEAPHLGDLRLGYRQAAFFFEVAALDYQRAEHNQFRYRLEPFDDGWIEAGTRRFASYTNLPPGDYELRARAAGTHGLWSEPETLLRIEIAAPPWKPGWAYALYTLALGGALFGFV
ncbi:MAG: two-component regulator propeller domain-containing protein, partial [Acidobacteriota bacterium]